MTDTGAARSRQAEVGAHLTIDLDALRANWLLLRDRVAPAECAAVVKADAYGIGIEAAVPALARAGCGTFFVAHLGEAARVRQAAPGALVYVLTGLLPATPPAYAALNVRPVLGSRPEIAEWAAFCETSGRLPAAIHVDTGMNRLGLPQSEAAALAADPVLSAFEPALLMSHLASADDPSDPATARQAAGFARLAALFPGVPASLANSSGIFRPECPSYALVRPGYALYGGNPTPGRPNPMRPVVRLEAPIAQVREVEAGARVGYNGRWTAPGPRRLATLALGYADGIPRMASGWDSVDAPAGAALVGGVLCPFVGTVSMDLIVIDVSDVPPRQAQRGATAVLIGDELDLDAIARRAGTIGYEILTRLGSRFARRIIGA